jgi:hypothetical protein
MNTSDGLVGPFRNLPSAKKLGPSFAVLAVALVAVVLPGSSGRSAVSAAHHDVVTVGVPKELAVEVARGAPEPSRGAPRVSPRPADRRVIRAIALRRRQAR